MTNEKLTKSQKRMREIVKKLQHYFATYDQQSGFDTYSDRILIDDVLYGLGMILDEKEYSFAPGFDKFKQKLREHLGPAHGSRSNEPSEQRCEFVGMYDIQCALKAGHEGKHKIFGPYGLGASRDASSLEQWPKSKAGEAPFCNCIAVVGKCAGWDEAINHGCCCSQATES